MKTKLLLLLIALSLLSCQKKLIETKALFETSEIKVDDQNTNYETKTPVTTKEINDKKCIDEKLIKDLNNNEKVKTQIADTDILFCNGIRIRLKTFQLTSRKFKAYGFIQTNSGIESCLTESNTFSNTLFLGTRGILLGENVKVLVGGHKLDKEGKLIPSDHLLARYVKFDTYTYNGELAVLENGFPSCWAIQ